MFESDYTKGAQLFSTGKQILLNWGKHGIIVKDPMIVSVNTEIQAPDYIDIYEDRLGKQIQKAVNNSIIELKIAASDIIVSPQAFKFEELIKEDLKIEDVLKIVHSQLK